jgi:erythromycin esterase-like protein
MTAIEAQLIERLKKLPPSRVAEVVDFVEFLSQREERAAAAQRLSAGLAGLDVLKLPQVTEDEVEAQIQAVRQERRSRQDA